MRPHSAAVLSILTAVLAACAAPAAGPSPRATRALAADAGPPALEAITEAELRIPVLVST